MKKSDLNIVIIDDEAGIRDTLCRALVEEGYKAKSFANPGDVLKELEVRQYHLAIVDCMLPSMNGLELAERMQSVSTTPIKFILISGIFRDATFIRDAVDRVKAVSFLKKPFDLHELLENVRHSFDDQLGPQTAPLYGFLLNKFDSNPELLQDAINNSPPFHGYEIPFIISVLQSNKVTGNLEIKFEDDDPACIKFLNGQIYQVQSNDTESYFGVLLIENGFSTPEEVAKGLSMDTQLPIGKRLWETNTLSPHAIEIVHREQMSIRLSKIIQHTSAKITFEKMDSDESEVFIDQDSFRLFLNEWISSKVKSSWIKSIYSPWTDHPLIKGPYFNQYKELKKVPLLNLVPDITGDLSDGLTLGQIQDKYENKPFLMQGIHFMLLNELIKFSSDRVVEEDYEAAIRRVKKFKESIESKDYYETFGVDKAAAPSKIQQTYHNFALSLHPDKVSPKAPKELMDLTTEVFQKLTEIQGVLLDPEKRKKYDFELEHGKAEQIIKVEALFEKGMVQLKNNNFQGACEAFDEIYNLDSYGDDFLIYYCWALIKRGAPASRKSELVQLIDKLLTMVPQEKRHNSDYFYVKGLFYKLSGDFEKASAAFKHSFTLNPQFKAAQIEWMSMEKNMKKPDFDDFTTGLFNAVGSIFKKK